VKRTFSAKPLRPLTDYYESAAQSREERLAFVSKLPAAWAPKRAWLRHAAKGLVKRWEHEKGDKALAFELVLGPNSVRALFPKRAERVLANWIKATHSETSDWVVLGRLLELEGGYPYDQVFADEFRSHVASELDRWHPTPPSLDELRALSDNFGTSDLDEELEKAMRQDSERDDRAADEAKDRRRIDPPAPQDDSDASIERYFDHF
jgi:hypothetical protein